MLSKVQKESLKYFLLKYLILFQQSESQLDKILENYFREEENDSKLEEESYNC